MYDFNEIILELKKNEKKSNCASKHVACIIFEKKTGKILSRGFNHSVSNISCDKKFRKIGGFWFFKSNRGFWMYDHTGSKHRKWSMRNEVHAEIHSLINLKYNNLDNMAALVSYSPCLDCCKSLICSGIKTIYYINEFDNISDIRQLCKDCNVDLICIKGFDNYGK